MNNQERVIGTALLKLSEQVQSLNVQMSLMAGQLEIAMGKIETFSKYFDKVRDTINLPPMFPADPEDEEYFYDEKSGDQFVYHEAEDEWDDCYWYDIKNSGHTWTV